MEEIRTLKSKPDITFKIKDLGNLQIFLGTELVRSSFGFSICQRKYPLELLHDRRLLGAKPSLTPMTESHKYLSSDESSPIDHIVYKKLIGMLIYLCTTQPGPSFSVQQLRQFMSFPTTIHLQVTYRMLRYIKNIHLKDCSSHPLPTFTSRLSVIQNRPRALISSILL